MSTVDRMDIGDEVTVTYITPYGIYHTHGEVTALTPHYYEVGEERFYYSEQAHVTIHD